MTAITLDPLSQKDSSLKTSPEHNDQDLQIQKIVSDALIVISSLIFMGTLALRLVVPITLSSLSILGAIVITIFTIGLIFRTKQEIYGLTTPGENTLNSSDQTATLSAHHELFKLQQLADRISQIFEHDVSKINYFITHRFSLRSGVTTLGTSYFNTNLRQALDYSQQLDELNPAWVEPFLKQIYTPAFLTPTFADDPDQARTEEILRFPKGFSNPSSNCFMHATLQAVFQNPTFASIILTQLETIAYSDKYHQRQPITSTDIPVTYNPVSTDADVLKKQQAAIENLRKTHDAFRINLFQSYDFDFILTNLNSFEQLIQLYLSCSLKDAACYSHALLSKWQKGSMLNIKESALLRLSLIKLMNRRAKISVCQKKSTEEYTADLTIPGLKGDFSIDFRIHEDASLFITNILESLDHLSHQIDPSLPPSVHVTTIKRKIQAYKLPNTDSDTHAFDPSLLIEGGTSEYTQTLFVHHLVGTNHTFKLDDLSFLSPYRSYENSSVTYGANENLPHTNEGDTVSEKHEYKIVMPEQLITSLKIFEYTQAGEVKHAKTGVIFTDEKNLTITFAQEPFFQEAQTYRLDSFIVHSGENLKGGHYLTYTRVIRTGDQTSYWIKQNDAQVEPCSCYEPLTILQGKTPYFNPFILIFSKI